jgi:hypothetical protein
LSRGGCALLVFPRFGGHLEKERGCPDAEEEAEV